jgi:hypothetical protein
MLDWRLAFTIAAGLVVAGLAVGLIGGIARKA